MKAETAPILDFISHLVSSLAWPSTVLTTIFLLRRHIQTLVPLVRTVKYSDVEIRFGQELAELKRATDISELPNAKHSAKAVPHWFFRVPVVLSAIRTFQWQTSCIAGDTTAAGKRSKLAVPRTVTTSKARLARAAPSRQRTQGYCA